MWPETFEQFHILLDAALAIISLVLGATLKNQIDRRNARATEKHTASADSQTAIESLWDENRKLRGELERVQNRVVILEAVQARAEVDKGKMVTTIKTHCRIWRVGPCPYLIETADEEALFIEKRTRERREAAEERAEREQ